MKKVLSVLMVAVALVCAACNGNDPVLGGGEVVANPTAPTDSTRMLIAYFSWGGTTQRRLPHSREPTCSVSNPLHPIPPSTLRPPRWRVPRKKPMHAPPSKTRCPTGSNTTSCLSAAPYGGGQRR